MEADFVIVGAGSAGCVLAEALSRSGRHSVLVLEAGGTDRRLWIQIPLGYGKTFYDKAVNWAYVTEPDPGLGNKPDYWPRGKVLGGSSSINAMVYIRGQPEDYEDWAAAGNPGWGWRDVLRVYRALEDDPAGDSAIHGHGGPLPVTDVSRDLHPLCRAFFAAGQQAGLRFNPDLNALDPEGVGPYRITTKGGRRASASRMFLRPAMRRSNLRVVTGAQVTGLVFDGGRAVGVSFRRNGETVTVRAGREVILSAGAVNSPQLLLLSGIGPAEDLRALGITPRVDNCHVGRNLQDHVGINYTFKARRPTLNQELRPWWGKLIAGMKYVFAGRGPLATSLNHGGGFFRTDPSQARPNMQLYLQALSTLRPAVGERPLLTPDPFPGFSIGLSNCRPTSRGSIALASADPLAAPRIDARAYATDHDVKEMLDAVKFVRRLASMPALAAEIVEELRPGPSVQSDEDLIADMRARSGTVYHPSCTCRMGPDPAVAVVDPRLRVHGVAGLRVVDASVFPNIISGNTNAPSIMVGARAGELILEDHA